MKYASILSITKMWEKIKSALNGKVDTTDSRLTDSRTPKSHASTATTYGVSTANNYGHAKASSTTPKANGTASTGSETGSFARGDHVHPTDSTRAPTSHAVAANTYGLGTTSLYGHVKTINVLTQTKYADGEALSAYQGYLLNQAIEDVKSALNDIQGNMDEQVLSMVIDTLVASNDINISLADSAGNELCGSDDSNLTAHLEIQFK
jgi:hypothetical protein